MHRFILLILLLAPVTSMANEAFTFATCQKTVTEKTLSHLAELGFAEQDTVEGLVLHGPITVEGVCISEVHVAAAPGALMFTGRICSTKLERLLKLFPVEPTSYPGAHQPGVIAASGSPGRLMMIYRGQPGFSPKPDPRSNEISYQCGYSIGE